MDELCYRTEDIRPEDILDLFVETQQDRDVVEALKAASPIVLVGSRGVGKSFLLRVAEAELSDSFAKQRVFPIYVTFRESSVIRTSDPVQFQHWMLARLCTYIIRYLRRDGLYSVAPESMSILAGGPANTNAAGKTRIEEITEAFESSWQNVDPTIDLTGLPTIDQFNDAIEEICRAADIRRLAVFIDEAAHIFLPEQQRQFFTLFRDIRSPYLGCNAAIYPGVTSFGETFQPAHDATLLTLNRNILSTDYVGNMKEIVVKQAGSTLAGNITRNGQNFAVLSYAASGNPRILLKTIARAQRINNQEVNEIVREYYRTDIWSEHSGLDQKYGGHRSLIDWGRQFIETHVLPELQKKNSIYLETDKNTTCFFWIHRDAPQLVKEALRLLAYTGIVSEHSTGIKATRSEIGTRYAVNLGCLFSLEAVPAATAFQIARSLTVKRMSEYGANHPSYSRLLAEVPKFVEPDMSGALQRQLEKSIDVLDITSWQKEQLRKLEIINVGDVLRTSETKLREIYYVGEKRSRRMRNAAVASVYEYLSG